VTTRWLAPLALVAPLVATDAPAAPLGLAAPWMLDAHAEMSAPVPRGPLVIADPLVAAFGFDRFATPELERPSEPGFFRGRFGARSWRLVPELSLEAPGAHADEADADASPLDAAPLLAVPSGTKKCKKRAVTFVRYGAEQDTFSLASCDGAILPDVMDRLSAILRPPSVDRPVVPLPDEPSDEAHGGEWVPGIRMIHPRLVWALERVAEAFPRRTFYVMSGYRPGHGGPHASARAIDLFVMNVANERVYKFCRTLPDVGCGYYPNNKFVHLDVRKPGTGKAYWIDTSAPGEPSEYVDAWPGVEKGGGAVFLRGERP
jgi:hypothetical protein